MIVRNPGDCSEELLWGLDLNTDVYATVSMYVDEPFRTSPVLGPDGKPFHLIEAKPKFGFDLTPSQPIPLQPIPSQDRERYWEMCWDTKWPEE